MENTLDRLNRVVCPRCKGQKCDICNFLGWLTIDGWLTLIENEFTQCTCNNSGILQNPSIFVPGKCTCGYKVPHFHCMKCNGVVGHLEFNKHILKWTLEMAKE